ncbi:MAG TPA: HAD family phosphatase [Oligoflexia bacterium]|nr:HAD family phosphatase [Oligoflexia bacterium]
MSFNAAENGLTIVCDVGKVLIDFSVEHFRAFLRRSGADFETDQEFIDQTNMHAYERGLISSEQYLQNIERILAKRPSRQELQRHWEDIFTPIPEMLALVESLKQKHPVYLLSNTNELHWYHLEREYALMSYANGALTSFEAGMAKPDSAIFALAEAKFGLLPQRTIYIDDLEQNVLAARKRNWLPIHHLSCKQTAAQLKQLGLDV